MLNHSTITRLALAFTLSLAATTVQAREVTLTHQGLTLNASLDMAEGKKLSDGVILLTHGMLAHKDMESLRYFRKLFRDQGHNVLAINLSLGLNNRHGMYDCKVTHRHLNDDAPVEIGLWLDWLNKQGAKKVVLAGHSRGGAQTALYSSGHDSALIKAVVLLAPATADNTGDAAFRERHKKPLAPVLDKAQKLVKAGKGKTVMNNTDFLYCPGTQVTAESFVSYYGPGSRVDAPSLLPKIRKPVLVVVASKDTAVKDLDKKVGPLADGKRIQMKVVSGSDHFFKDLNADDAVDAIMAFLKGVGY